MIGSAEITVPTREGGLVFKIHATDVFGVLEDIFRAFAEGQTTTKVQRITETTKVQRITETTWYPDERMT